MLKSISEDNSRNLTELANELGIKQEQIVQIIRNGEQLTLFYYDGSEEGV